MTELEQYVAMLTRCGVPFEMVGPRTMSSDDGLPFAFDVRIKVEVTSSPRTGGHHGFFTVHAFGEDGDLVGVEIWE